MRFASLILVGLALAGCDDAKFSSSTNKDGSDRQSDYDAQQNQKPPGDNGQSERNGANGTVGGVGGNICIGNSLAMNLVLVFDRSGSQSTADQANMVNGARSFLQNLSRLKEGGLDISVKASVVRFNGSSEIGSHRWQDIHSPTGLNAVFQDVAWANTAPGGGTYYHLALQNAATLFSEIGAQADHKRQRNYIVFLSDGSPYAGTSVISAARSITEKFGAVYFSIGVGLDNESYLKQMAALTNAVSPADHRGKFINADRNAQDVARAFADTASLIRGICK